MIAKKKKTQMIKLDVPHNFDKPSCIIFLLFEEKKSIVNKTVKM